MTEAEWLAVTDPTPMLEFLEGRTSDRKLRLAAASLCSRLFGSVLDDRSRTVIRRTEEMADGKATTSTIKRVHRQAFKVWNARQENIKSGQLPRDLRACGAAEALCLITATDRPVVEVLAGAAFLCRMTLGKGRCASESEFQSRLIRDIFGNPFRPVAVESAWLTSTVTALAEGMYANRDFSTMPILADALQDAGCENEDILNHCRDANQVHVRGCWVVDLVLGKT